MSSLILNIVPHIIDPLLKTILDMRNTLKSMRSLILSIILYVISYEPLVKHHIKNDKTLKVNEIPNSRYDSLLFCINPILKAILKMRNTLKIKEIPNSNYDEGNLG